MNNTDILRSVTLALAQFDKSLLKSGSRESYDFANIIRTVVCTEQLAEESAHSSSRHLEQRFKPQSFKRRDSQVGEQNSGLLAKHRRGDCIPALSLRDKIGELFPQVRQTENSLVWDYLRNGFFPFETLKENVNLLGDEVFWTIYQPSQSDSRYRRNKVGYRTINEDLLCRLVLLGSLDAVLALLLLIHDLKTTPTAHAFAGFIAQYIPPTLVLLSLRQPWTRVVPLILARLRQIELDQLVFRENYLLLADYDINAMAIKASHWTREVRPPGLPSQAYIAHWINQADMPISPDSKALVASLLPTYRPVQGTDTIPKWRPSIPPLAVSGSGRTPQTTFTKRAVRVFQSTLDNYWNAPAL